VAVFDHGPLGYLSIAAHGHAVARALWLDVANRPVLVDAGTWLYHGGGADRDALRMTAAHNTVLIEGQSQSLPAGAFNCRSGRAPACSAPPTRSRGGSPASTTAIGAGSACAMSGASRRRAPAPS
jgi:hypothetical protein